MKKFLCYDTNDAASGKIGVDNRGMLKPNSTVPSTNGAANQQLVTDGEGGAKWEDKLAYEFFNPLIEQVAVSCTTALTEIEGYVGDSYYTFVSMRESDTASSTFEIIYDGTRYIVERHALSDHISIDSYNFVEYVGDPYLKEYPFAIEFRYDHNTVFTKTSGEHTFVVNASSVKQIDQKFIPPQTVYVNATGGDEQETEMGVLYANVTLDKTYDEILALLKRGVDVKIIRENVILDCLRSDENEIFFSAYFPLNGSVTLICGIRADNSAIVAVNHLDDQFLQIGIDGKLVAPLILKSGTPGSSKKFKITVDDSGAISATEV